MLTKLFLHYFTQAKLQNECELFDQNDSKKYVLNSSEMIL